MTALPPEADTPMQSFQWGLPTVQIWCFWLLCDWKYTDFQTGHSANFEQFKVNIHSANFGQVKTDPIFFFYWLWTVHSYFAVFGQDMPQKTIQKIQEPCIGSGTGHFQ